MSHLLGRFRADVKVWKQAIEADRQAHTTAGLHFERVWENIDNPGEIFFLFRLDDTSVARAFLENAGALDREKQKRGEIPELIWLDDA